MNLRDGQLRVGSGAVGSCLRTGAGPEPVELWNLRQPDRVRALHAAYLAAGSQILVTNTFAAQRPALEMADCADRVGDINRAGVALAREAAQDRAWVWASVGALGLGLALDDFSDADLMEVYREQCGALCAADALLLETFADVREARAALAAASEVGRPIIFQLGPMAAGAGRWERAAELVRLAEPRAVALGCNCRNPTEVAEVIRFLAGLTRLPLTAAPNAGQPRIERGAVTYELNPDAFARAADPVVAQGVVVFGGCCGTTPAHIRAVALALAGRAISAPAVRAPPPAPSAGARSVGRPAPNPVRDLLSKPRVLISVEVRADRMLPLAEIVRAARLLVEAGADLLDVPDNPGATVGRDALVTASRLQQELGRPTIAHASVTQSNLLRTYSALLGGWDLGVRGLLAVTGDAPALGPLAPWARRVADVRTSVELLRLIRGLREGRLLNGEQLAEPPDFCAGCAVGRPTPGQVRWLRAKVEAGAEFVFSQPVFRVEDYARLRDAVGDLPIRFFPGILPLTSRRSAETLAAGKVPGIEVPSEVVSAYERYSSPEDQRRHGLAAAGELACAIASAARGIYLIPPFGRRGCGDAVEIVRRIRAVAGRGATPALS